MSKHGVKSGPEALTKAFHAGMRAMLVRLQLLTMLAIAALLGFSHSAAAADGPRWLTGYYAFYHYNDVMKTDQFDYSKLTHAIFWPVLPKSDGTLDTTTFLGSQASFDTVANDFVTRAHAAGTKALLGIGGDQSIGATAAFQANTATAAKRTAFITNIMNMVKQYKFDGVDINWEQIRKGTDDANYLAFFQELRTQLNTLAPKGLLTIAPEIPRNSGYGDFPYTEFANLIAQVAPSVDQINVQTYIMSGAYDGFDSWFNSPLNPGANFSSTATPPSIQGEFKKFTDAGVPRGKLAFGIQTVLALWQGNKIKGANEGAVKPRQPIDVSVTQPGVILDSSNPPTHYRDLATKYNTGYTAPVIDPDALQSWIAKSTNPAGYKNDQFINYDSPESLAQKGTALSASTAAGVGGDLGGAFIFELSGDFAGTSLPLADRNPLLKAANKMKVLLPRLLSNAKATAGNAFVTLSWSATDGAGFYNIYASNDGVRGAKIAGNVTSTSYKHAGLTNGTKYAYLIVPANRFGEGANSAEVSATPASSTVPTPVFDPGSQTSDRGLIVGLTVADNTAEIYYTQLAGTTPPTPPASRTATGVLKYDKTKGIPVYDQRSFAARAFRADGSSGVATTASYNVTISGKTRAPRFVYVDGSTFNGSVNISIAPGTGFFSETEQEYTIYYNLGSTKPTCTHVAGSYEASCTAGAKKYTGPFPLSQTSTINALAISVDYDSSDVVTANYTKTANTTPPVPVLTPGGSSGTYLYQYLGAALSIKADDKLINTNLFYTLSTNGVDPPDPTSTESATNIAIAHGGPISISKDNTIVKLRAFNSSGGIASPVARIKYQRYPAAAAPVMNPPASRRTVANAPSVAMSSSTPNAKIYYNVNSTYDPYPVPRISPFQPPSPTLYSAPVPIGRSSTIKATALADSYSISAIASSRYVLVPEKPTFDKASNVAYPGGVTVKISSATPGVNFFYTTDGSKPVSSGTPGGTGDAVSVPLTVSTRLRAITSKLPDLEDSDETSALYKVPLQAVWIPDFYAQNVNVRTGTGANLKSVALNTTPANCSPNSVAVSKDAYLYVACIPINGADDKILVYDALTIKNAARPVAEKAKLDLVPLKTIKANPNGVSFAGLIGLAFDSEQNLWTTSYDNSRVFSISAAALQTNAPLAQARLQNTPPSPAGLAFDTDGSLWVVSNDGRLFNLEKSKLQGNDADINPSYYIGFDSTPGPAVPFKKPEGVALYGNLNGKSKVWVSNNGSFEQGQTMVWFTKGVAGTGGGVGTLVQGSPTVTGGGQNILRCPGGLFATPKRLWLNDQGFGKPTTVCGADDTDRASGVGAIINFTNAQLGAAAANQIKEAQLLRNATSRPGFGGIFVEDEE